MNKRILLSLGTLVVAGAVIAGGTGAFFSDTETSTGNVFTAGDVNLELSGLEHTYLAEEDEANLPANYVNVDSVNNSFQFGDLKPLDWGSLDGELTNTGNPAYVCAQVVAPNTATESPFDGLLKFRVNNGLGLTVADTLTLTGLNEWFSLDLSDPALAMDSGQTLPSSVEYCFGDFEAGGDCVIDENVDYNPAQGQTLTLDIEYYAVQQRNNDDFTCAGMNEPVITPVDASGPFDGWNGAGALIWQAEGRFGDNTASGDWEVGVGTNTQTANQDNTNNIWVSGTAVPFTVVYDGANATFTVNGNSATYAVGAVTSTADLNIIAGKVSAGASDSVALSNLELDGAPVNPASLTDTDDTDAQYLVIDSEDLSSGFTLTGDVTFTWTSGTTGSRPAFQVQVRD